MTEPTTVCKMCQTECETKIIGNFANRDRVANLSKCCNALVYITGGEEYIGDPFSNENP